MKHLVTLIALAFATNVNAQLIIDDFATGGLDTTSVSDLGPTVTYQQGAMVGGHRMLNVHVTNKRDDQNVQVRIRQNKLVASFGYNTVGTIKVNYGSTPNGPAPMNMPLREDQTLIVEFEAKSSISGMYVSFFSDSDHAYWTDHVEASTGTVKVRIPLSEMKPTGKNFNLADIDYMRFQFDSRTVTGHNFAIKRIWIE